MSGTTRHGGTVYLIHFARPVCGHRPARHYLGFVSAGRTPEERLEDHRSGRGARITAAAAARGIALALVRTWPGSRKTERKLKCRKSAPRLCPLCRAG